MNRPAVTMYVWTAYMSFVGSLLLASPVWLFESIGFRDPGDGMWVRLNGMFFLILAYYCYHAGRTNNRQFMRWTVTTRTWPILFVTAFAVLQLENPLIVLFGVIDLFAAYWTYRSLRETSETTQIDRVNPLHKVEIQ